MAAYYRLTKSNLRNKACYHHETVDHFAISLLSKHLPSYEAQLNICNLCTRKDTFAVQSARDRLAAYSHHEIRGTINLDKKSTRRIIKEEEQLKVHIISEIKDCEIEMQAFFRYWRMVKVEKPYYGLTIRTNILWRYLDSTLMIDHHTVAAYGNSRLHDNLISFQKKFLGMLIACMLERSYYHYARYSEMDKRAVIFPTKLVSKFIRCPQNCEYGTLPSHYPERFVHEEKEQSSIERKTQPTCIVLSVMFYESGEDHMHGSVLYMYYRGCRFMYCIPERTDCMEAVNNCTNYKGCLKHSRFPSTSDETSDSSSDYSFTE